MIHWATWFSTDNMQSYSIIVLCVILGMHRHRIHRLERNLADIRRVFTIEQSMERIATVLDRSSKKGADV